MLHLEISGKLLAVIFPLLLKSLNPSVGRLIFVVPPFFVGVNVQNQFEIWQSIGGKWLNEVAELQITGSITGA